MVASVYENLLVTMALYAGEMNVNDNIDLPSGNVGEGVLAEFCVECVKRWMAPDGLVDENGDYPDISFCEYAKQCLVERFPHMDQPELPSYDGRQYKVVAVAGSVWQDMGIQGTHEECEKWCDYYDWVWRPDGEGGFEWELYVEEV